MDFGGERGMVVERYDRRRVEGRLRRVHQEDICQALGLPPTKKYENEGGPGVRHIVELLRTHSTDRDQDIETFLEAVAFNWLDRKSTRLNSSHQIISYAVFCFKK